MATVIRATRISVAQDGTMTVVFESSVSGETWKTMPPEAIAQAIAACETEDMAIGYWLAYWKSRDEDFSNPNIMLDKDLTADFSNPNPIRVS